MTREEYRAAIDDVIYLVSCAVNDEKPDAKKTCAMNLVHVCAAAQRHLLIAAVGMALQSAGVQDTQITQAMAKAQRKNALMDADRAALFAHLEQAGIWYMPLKGAVLADLYPQYGMREMADNDILIDPERTEDVKAVMESLGFTTERFGRSNNDVYHKPPVSSFEIHFALFGPFHDEKLYQYYRDVKSRLVKDEGNSCGWHFTPEDFYIYMIAHEYKHYSSGGTGLRSLLDIFVYLGKEKPNMAYVSAEAEKLGIAEFEAASRSLALHLFSGEELTAAEQEMLEYILSSGTFGTMQNRVKNRIGKYGNGLWGKLRYGFRRLFLPMNVVRTSFPLFIKCPILLPFLPAYRVFRGLTVQRDRMRAELRALMEHKANYGGHVFRHIDK